MLVRAMRNYEKLRFLAADWLTGRDSRISGMWKITTTKTDRRKSVVRVMAMVLLLLVVALGSFLFGRSQSPAEISGKDKESLKLYAEALHLVREDYVDQKSVNPRKQT